MRSESEGGGDIDPLISSTSRCTISFSILEVVRQAQVDEMIC